MRILVTGRDGQLGAELAQSLRRLGAVVAVGREEMDLARLDQLESTLHRVRPDLIVNAAAYTDVERAERESALAMVINADAPELMARYAARHAAALVHFSTDYVFDGDAGRPYVECDLPRPLMAYGRSKLDGEQRIRRTEAPCLIFRTSWVYSHRGRNFVTKMAELFERRNELAVVDDQLGAPTYAPHLAEAVTAVLAQLSYDDLRRMRAGSTGATSPIGPTNPTDSFGGLFHLTGSGETTWYGLASEALSLIQRSAIGHRMTVRALRPIPSSEYPSTVRRPRDSRLDCSATAARFGVTLPTWPDGLRECIRRIATDR